MINRQYQSQLRKLRDLTQKRLEPTEDKCDEFIAFSVKPEYRAATKQLSLKFNIKAKKPGGLVQTFGASVNFKIPKGRREAQCNGILDIPEYAGEVIILPVDLKSGKHQGGYLVGAFVEIDGVSTLCLKSGTFDFQT